MKSVIAGEYTAPPAQGPIITEICGITPEAKTFFWKTSPYPANEATPSCIRAPPESLIPIIGAPTFKAMSITLQIFSAWASDNEPPNTVKSWLKTYTSFPFIFPLPVTTLSPGYFCFAIPKSFVLCSTYMSYSSKEFSSRRTSILSLAVSLPLACWASTLFLPPPSLAWLLFFSNSLIIDVI